MAMLGKIVIGSGFKAECEKEKNESFIMLSQKKILGQQNEYGMYKKLKESRTSIKLMVIKLNSYNFFHILINNCIYKYTEILNKNFIKSIIEKTIEEIEIHRMNREII